jgi:hypothetical protein
VKQTAKQLEAIESLRFLLKAGDMVYTTVQHVSQSGMSRDIKALIQREGRIEDISYLVARVIDHKVNERNGGVRIQGAGMDMGFNLVYLLSHALFPGGFECTGIDEHPNRCPSNDHSNGDRDYSKHLHQSGGYALQHRWI